MNGTKIFLQNEQRWKQGTRGDATFYFSGYIYVGNTLYTNHTITDYLSQVEFTEKLITDWSGEFAVIYQTSNYTFAACDRKRSIPLFYYKKGNEVVVTDRLVDETQGTSLNRTSAVEFLLTGFVANDRTLFDDVFQIEAGQSIIIRQDKIEKLQYYRYYHNPENMDIETGVEELTKSFHNLFQKLYDRVKDKHVMIPLSGGYDSRIIALLLKEYGVKSVEGFTYGRPGNQEAKKSKEIADKLGIPWTFIPYSREDWQRWYHSSEWKNYLHFATNASSMAHLQDWPAVTEIINKADKDYVFMPGHSGDFIAGSHLSYEIIQDKSYTLDDVVEQIMKKHHRLWETSNQAAVSDVISEIKSSLKGLDYDNKEQASALFEYWDWKERQAKFIINSLRVYEYYNQEWEIPLWDDELMNFFLKVPTEYRFKKYLYDMTLHHMYPTFFEKPIQKSGSATSLKNKYGALYPILKKAYNKKRVYQQYYKDPMEWFGIYGGYVNYLRNISFKYEKVRFENPYNINSFLAKDYIQNVKG
ncbi:hypothetical protein IMZ08_03275 [Bacillus luteolus]|uniref:asparagine synthase (glutamine-hydrolyzing) n=1 Tax=Litchfieldia luteola TaxID=682179 RepID=A0ABR9QF30_9BACI|nr:asparagine synthase C-terminal domain-containing protein [Cytobacillus luteolus]MBE4907078.1 hypothetical protein [Cytobacillus luteolus]MBP1943455.1 asparagine synthase (glutamine-hydrolyzing) [Cytobacillus luteolus]